MARAGGQAQGDARRATALLEEGLALWRDQGSGWGSARALKNLADLARDQGDVERARALYQESVAQAHEDRVPVARCLEGLAAVACVQGQAARAAGLLGAAAALREVLGMPLPPADRAFYDQTMAAARTALGADACAAACAAGQRLSLEQAIAEAMYPVAGSGPRNAPTVAELD